MLLLGGVRLIDDQNREIQVGVPVGALLRLAARIAALVEAILEKIPEHGLGLDGAGRVRADALQQGDQPGLAAHSFLQKRLLVERAGGDGGADGGADRGLLLRIEASEPVFGMFRHALELRLAALGNGSVQVFFPVLAIVVGKLPFQVRNLLVPQLQGQLGQQRQGLVEDAHGGAAQPVGVGAQRFALDRLAHTGLCLLQQQHIVLQLGLAVPGE